MYLSLLLNNEEITKPEQSLKKEGIKSEDSYCNALTFPLIILINNMFAAYTTFYFFFLN